MAKITDKRKNELKEIAKQLHYANLSPSATEDVVSICATVSKGFDGHAGEELTLDEGTLVDEYIGEIEESEQESKRKEFIKPLLSQVLSGETVRVGTFQVRENFIYKREKDDKGQPLFDRVISLAYFDEDEDESPSTEEFDGTVDSFYRCLNAHDAFVMFDAGDDDGSQDE